VRGLRRLSTFLAFLRLATGKLLPAGFNYIALLDEEVLNEKLGEYIALVFTGNVAEGRGL